MSTIPTLSVVIPVFNTESTIKRCIDSIIAQPCSDQIEIIIVDDCSPGYVEEVVKDYLSLNIKLIRHERNKGLFQARVTGSLMATGEFIAFVDSDDYVSIDFYRPMLEAAICKNADIVAGTTIRRSEEGKCYQHQLHKNIFPAELHGKAIQDTFFGQEGACYAWHTVWNKIYRKSLWDKCLPAYQSITGHVIMTEDVAFSSLLFYHAKHFVSVKNGAYYYCFNPNCSTNQSKPIFSKFEKNVTDMITVFDFVTEQLKKEGAENEILKHVAKFRQNYARQWLGLWRDAFSRTLDAPQGLRLLRKLADSPIEKSERYVSWFEIGESELSDELEAIRHQIADPAVKYVSFDIFDTLVVRSLWNATDVFEFMQPEFSRMVPAHAKTKFCEWRQTAEESCRNKFGNRMGVEDITLTQIYGELKELLNLSSEVTTTLLDLEVRTELHFLSRRETGGKLVDFALACGKKVIYTSDMYLETPHIRAILEQCGYPELPLYLSSSLGILKSSGTLFKHVVRDLHVTANEILHIGDTWAVDIIKAQESGLRTAFLPKTRDIFTDGYHRNPTNDLSRIGYLAGANFTSPDMMMKSRDFRSMLAIVANHLFDDPFVSWTPNSDLDANPDVIGYYVLGMHMVGISAWLGCLLKKYGTKHLVFLGRDGYLPHQAFNHMMSYLNLEGVVTSYVPCSRRALLPISIDSKEGLFHLPVSYRSHTPESILKLISCCHNIQETDMVNVITMAGFAAESRFKNVAPYLNFIRWVADNVFDQAKLDRCKKITAEYYAAHIPTDAIVFDLGYSGSIAGNLDRAVGCHLHHAFVHRDVTSFDRNVRQDGTSIDVMYGFVAQNRDLIRELVVSELDNQCLGFETKNGIIEPVFKSDERSKAERFVIDRLFKGALDFVDDFSQTFSKLMQATEIHPEVVSVPFEGFLVTQNKVDQSVFGCVRSDDTVYGNNDDISVSDFWAALPDETYHPYVTNNSFNESGSFKKVDVLGWKKALDVYRHPWAVIKYRLLSRLALSSKKRKHYRKRLSLPHYG